MTEILYRTPENWHEVSADTRFGIYVVKSIATPDLYRIGSAGTKSVNTRLKHRITLHSSKRSNGNWTVANRPWELRWAAEIRTADNVAFGVLALEYALYAHFAQHFKAITTSGFDVAGQHHKVARVISDFIPMIDRIRLTQFG